MSIVDCNLLLTITYMLRFSALSYLLNSLTTDYLRMLSYLPNLLSMSLGTAFLLTIKSIVLAMI